MFETAVFEFPLELLDALEGVDAPGLLGQHRELALLRYELRPGIEGLLFELAQGH